MSEKNESLLDEVSTSWSYIAIIIESLLIAFYFAAEHNSWLIFGIIIGITIISLCIKKLRYIYTIILTLGITSVFGYILFNSKIPWYWNIVILLIIFIVVAAINHAGLPAEQKQVNASDNTSGN